MAADDFKGDSLRQRLVGGIALLIIGVIAWFWLLSADSPVDPVSRSTQIPAAPDIQPFSVPEPTPSADVAPIHSESDSQPALRADIAADKPAPVTNKLASEVAPEPSRVAVSQPKSTPQKTQMAAGKTQVAAGKMRVATEKMQSTKPKETFELDQQGLPVAWVVQVGLFSNQVAADKVKATLQQKGIKAYSESYKTDGAPKGVKVFVGPKLSRERAIEQKRAIDAALNVDSKIVRFQSPQH